MTRPADVRAWLAGRPALDELKERFPADWEAVQRDLAKLVPRGRPEELKAYASAPPVPRAKDARVTQEIRRQMALQALRQLSLSAATGVQDGHVRFNLVNGKIMNRLFFERDLVRKPVNLRAFRLLWPLLWQKRFLMPLVGPRGIYCFYSAPLVARLAALIGARQTVEIAAGDGTLTRFLRDAGVDVVATDDHSWRDVTFGPDVVKQDAREALRRRRPQAVICSWPPAGNAFERHVFTTGSVELYVVIASEHHFAAGDWESYERQDAFELRRDAELGRLVLPPELNAAVYIFSRR